MAENIASAWDLAVKIGGSKAGPQPWAACVEPVSCDQELGILCAVVWELWMGTSLLGPVSASPVEVMNLQTPKSTAELPQVQGDGVDPFAICLSLFYPQCVGGVITLSSALGELYLERMFTSKPASINRSFAS